jgi:uncharacterized membrane protein
MMTSLRDVHRFLANRSAYPLVLATLLAGDIYVGRVMISHRWTDFALLVWNLFLAWIPYGCSLIVALLNRSWPKNWWMLLVPGGLWLAFFPNAPYIVTDFYHLQVRLPVPLWYDIGLISIFAFTGCFLAIASLRIMQSIFEKYTGKLVGWVFAIGSLLLGGLGVYLGRFGRYNSWDLVIRPQLVLSDIATRVLNPLDNLRFVIFTLMFTAILFVFYLMFTSINRIEE